MQQIAAGPGYLEIRPSIDVLQAEAPGAPEIITHGELAAPVTGYLYMLKPLAKPVGGRTRRLRAESDQTGNYCSKDDKRNHRSIAMRLSGHKP